MPKQSRSQQVAYGAIFGAIFYFTAGLRGENAPMLSASGIGELFGSVFAGVVLYMVLYRFWPGDRREK